MEIKRLMKEYSDICCVFTGNKLTIWRGSVLKEEKEHFNKKIEHLIKQTK